jgi:hypothetical protein
MKIRDAFATRSLKPAPTPRLAPPTDLGLGRLGDRLERMADRMAGQDRQDRAIELGEAKQNQREREAEVRFEQRQAEAEAKQQQRQQEAEADALSLFRQAAEAREAWSGQGREAVDQGTAGETGWIDTWGASLDQDIAARVAAAPERLRPRLELDLRQTRSSVLDSFTGAATGLRSAQAVNEGGTALDAIVNATRQNPRLLEDNMRAADAVIDALDAPDQVKDQMRREYRSQIAGAALQRAIELNPAAALARIRGGEFDGILLPGALEQAADQALAEKEQNDREAEARAAQARMEARQRAEIAERRAREQRMEQRQQAAIAQAAREDARRTEIARAQPYVESRMQGNLMSLAQTGRSAADAPTVAEVEQTFGPTAASRYSLQLRQAEQVGSQFGRADGLSASQLSQRLATLRPRPGQAGYAEAQAVYQTASGMVQETLAARREDPVAYWRSTQRYGDATTLLRRRRPDLTAAQVDAAILAELQGRDGARRGQMRYLTNERARAIAPAFQPGSGENGAAALDRLQRDYGSLTPNVLAEVGAAAGSGNRIPLILAAVPAANRTTAAQALLAPGEARRASQAVQTAVRSELAPLRNSFAGLPGTDMQFNDIVSGANTMAAQFVREGQTEREAAANAAAMFMSGYSFRGGLRIPESTIRPNVAVNATGSTRALLLRQPDLLAPVGGSPGQPDARRQAAYASALQRNSRWISLADDSGVVLVDANNRPVRLANGREARFSWQEIGRLHGNAARSTWAAGVRGGDR